MAEKVRIDKWLWSVRIFKSRSIACEACRSNAVRVDNVPVKPSAMVVAGQTVTVKKDGFNLTYRVEQLIEKRVGAPIARTCYTDLTPEEERNKYKNWFVSSEAAERRERGSGRPTKKERRDIGKVKGR